MLLISKRGIDYDIDIAVLCCEYEICFSLTNHVENRHNTQKNKARYTATQFACRWAGAIFEVTRLFGQEQCGPKIKIIKKVKCDH